MGGRREVDRAFLQRHKWRVKERPVRSGGPRSRPARALTELEMQWTGKVVGALVGLVAGPVGALVGAVIGHGYDLSQQSRAAGGTDAAGPEPTSVGEVLFSTAFAVMGHLAKADGRVSEAEIDAARTVMRQMQLAPDQVRQAIDCFTRGKQPDYPLQAELARLRAACGARHDLLRFFVEIQMRAALVGNDLQGPVRARLHAIASHLGFGGLELAQLEATLRLQLGRGWTVPPQARNARLETAYQVLGITAAAGDDEVKKAYRRQMNENHPDKLIARGLPESMQELAKEKTQRIREAYEAICEHRGIR
jgi:DnaJ like chaperone protein